MVHQNNKIFIKMKTKTRRQKTSSTQSREINQVKIKTMLWNKGIHVEHQSSSNTTKWSQTDNLSKRIKSSTNDEQHQNLSLNLDKT
jgi:D-hexose-6-phosphate mutarotase